MKQVKEGDIIQFYTNKFLKIKKQTSKVEYKEGFGYYCIVNNRLYELNKLYDIDIISSNNITNNVDDEEMMFNSLPKKWEDIENIKGYYICSDSTVYDNMRYKNNNSRYYHRNVFVNEELAQASKALSQLSQLREIYRQGWKPRWLNIDEPKFIIRVTMDEIETGVSFTLNQFLSFQNYEVRDEFLKNFKDLILEASPLLFDLTGVRDIIKMKELWK